MHSIAQKQAEGRGLGSSCKTTGPNSRKLILRQFEQKEQNKVRAGMLFCSNKHSNKRPFNMQVLARPAHVFQKH